MTDACEPTPTDGAQEKVSAVVKYFRDFKVLKETKREYWGLQLINMLDCLAYFAMFNIATVTLSNDFGFTDAWAGIIYAIFSGLTTIFLFFSGVVTDWLGIKKALYIAVIGLILTRGGVVLAERMDEPVRLDHGSSIAALYDGEGIPFADGESDLTITARDGTSIPVDLSGATTLGQVLGRINDAPGNEGRIAASIAPGWVSLRLSDQSASTYPGMLRVSGSAAAPLGLETAGHSSGVLDGGRLVSELNGVAPSELNQGRGMAEAGTLHIRDAWGSEVTIERLEEQPNLRAVRDAIAAAASDAGLRIGVDFNAAGNGLMISDRNSREPLSLATPLASLHGGEGVPVGLDPATMQLLLTAHDGSTYEVGFGGCQTLGDLSARVEAATSGHLRLELSNGSKLLLRDTRVVPNQELLSGRLAATGIGIEGVAIARKFGLYLERGTDQATLLGNAIPHPRWAAGDGSAPQLASHSLLVDGSAAEPLGIAYTEAGTAVSGENIVENKLRSFLVIGLLALMAPFMAMLITIFQAGNRRFTTSRSRGAAFNLWYLFMNVGAAGGGFLIDIIYLKMGLPHYHIFTFGLVTGVLCLFAIVFFIRNTDQLRTPEEIEAEKERVAKEGEQEKKEPLGPWQIVKAVLSESVFWRFTVLITLLLGVRAVFLYLGLLFPKFWYRVIGADAQVGLMQAFNPILVIIGLILVIPLLQKFNVYKMLVFGALITSISMFIPAIPPLAGFGIVEWTYIMTGVFLLVLTIGELIWSPRLSEYTAAIAPEGQEGTYLGLSMVPYFLAKLVVSGLSGAMLARWCPGSAPGEPNMGERIAAGEVAFADSPYFMWLILGAVALAGTLVAILGKSWFTEGLED